MRDASAVGTGCVRLKIRSTIGDSRSRQVGHGSPSLQSWLQIGLPARTFDMVIVHSVPPGFWKFARCRLPPEKQPTICIYSNASYFDSYHIILLVSTLVKEYLSPLPVLARLGGPPLRVLLGPAAGGHSCEPEPGASLMPELSPLAAFLSSRTNTGAATSPGSVSTRSRGALSPRGG